MRFMAVGDLHLTNKTPENRIDNYPETQFQKVKWFLNLAVEKQCAAILQPGDFFDTSTVSNDLMRKYINLLKSCQVPVLTVLGQHDQRYHNSSLDNTPLGVLDAAGAVRILSEGESQLLEDGSVIALYGAGWEAPIPKPYNRKAYNILVCHKMIISDKKIWFGQSGHVLARPFLLKSGFNFIVSGDNHEGFKTTNKGGNRHLVNCGSLMRSRIDQMAHKPKVYIIDVVRNELDEYEIPIKPAKKIMEVNEIEEKKSRNLKLESFIQQLSEDATISGLDFKRNLVEYVKENKVDDGVEKIIKKILAECE